MKRWREKKILGRKRGRECGLIDSKDCPGAAEEGLNCCRTQLGIVTNISPEP